LSVSFIKKISNKKANLKSDIRFEIIQNDNH